MKGNLKLLSGIRIRSPLSNKTRPTTSKAREALINILGKNLQETSWLDLCSGSGVMACEALQKGTRRIVAIEKHRSTAHICKTNLLDVSNKLGLKAHIDVISKEVISFLKKGPKNQEIKFIRDLPNFDHRFDFVFLDPPYDSELYESSQEFLLSKEWIKKTSTLICECSSKSRIKIHNGWKLDKERIYGKSSFLFLTPNQALNYFDDIDSMH